MRALVAFVAIAPLSLGAQVSPSSGNAVPRDPADPAAQVAPLGYQSPFAGYRLFADRGVGPWRGVNDEVGRIGGWKAYAREVFEANEAGKGATLPPPAKGVDGMPGDGAPRDK